MKINLCLMIATCILSYNNLFAEASTSKLLCTDSQNIKTIISIIDDGAGDRTIDLFSPSLESLIDVADAENFQHLEFAISNLTIEKSDGKILIKVNNSNLQFVCQ